MEIVIAGAHGQIAMLLHPLLRAQGHQLRGLVRNPQHVDELRQLGVEAVICDLESENDIAEAVGQADAVIFAAGAGPGSGATRKDSMDRDGALRLIDAAKSNAIQRYIMISAMDAERPRGDDVFRVYLRAKSEADEALRQSGLDYTIVRPGRLTNDAERGMVRLAPSLPEGEIPRADVAAVIAQALEVASTIGHQFDVTTGDQPIAEALASL